MSLINVLDMATINKIAAGEVVERPASVIKELVENAMDAGATRIEVEIAAGGIALMRVTDNGRGMSTEDAALALKRHATSKIKDVKDISHILTLGFRGEALPTIASVSKFTLLTRPKEEELGTKVEVSGGRDSEITPVGVSSGTTVRVEDLFFNTPARKKFLKTTGTEAGRISDYLVKLALSRPDIAFRFINNNKLTLTTPGGGKLKDTIAGIYGPEVASALLPLSFQDEEIAITGFITKPTNLRSSRSWQTAVVNGRIIRSLAILKAIDNAYKALVPKNGYPLAVLNIKVAPETVDVNVHPQKTEIKFADEGRIFKAVYKAVTDAVRETGKSLPQVAAAMYQAEKYHKVKSGGEAPSAIDLGLYENNHAAADWQAAQAAVRRAEPRPQETAIISTETIGDGLADYTVGLSQPTGGITPIGQIDKCYIVAQDAKGLYIIDQHAAHERILFDRLSALADAIPAQGLLVHPLLKFPPAEAMLVEEHQDTLKELAFSLEPSGDLEYRLREIPADIPVAEAEDTVREILTLLAEKQNVTAQEIRQECLAVTACRAAIKAGDELSLRQMAIVLEELSRTAFPYTCPHGRPTIIKFASDELAKMFKRTGFDLHRR